MSQHSFFPSNWQSTSIPYKQRHLTAFFICSVLPSAVQELWVFVWSDLLLRPGRQQSRVQICPHSSSLSQRINALSHGPCPPFGGTRSRMPLTHGIHRHSSDILPLPPPLSLFLSLSLTLFIFPRCQRYFSSLWPLKALYCAWVMNSVFSFIQPTSGYSHRVYPALIRLCILESNSWCL